ncbi:11209_t:CDS:1 [Acaulospora morrowiae]|uniref:11209_t:CDS:1 n=1 Tax=Acaulospora morrowiae TaxID=94023 RepID=A0A9N8YNG4_9GLOM|nr:11209_t:CDS:1 [Acaulospora morrowiae]
MPEITVTVKCSNDQKYSVKIDTSKTVLEFKNAIAEQSNTAADRQRLIYSGRVLKDNDTLDTYKITEGHTVHMVRSQATTSKYPKYCSHESNNSTKYLNDSACHDIKIILFFYRSWEVHCKISLYSCPSISCTLLFNDPDTSQTSSRTTTPPATTSENPPPTTQPSVPPSTLPATNPFGQLGLGFNGLNQNPYGLANPMMIEQILQNPVMMQHMQQMIQDPTFIENMIAMYPNLAQVAPQLRQMLQDPEVLSLMSNPETLRMAAIQSMMGPGPFTGGVPGSTTPATTTNNNQTTTPNLSSTTPNAGTTTPITPANNPLFYGLFNPSATSQTGTGTNPAQPPVMPLFDPALLFGAFGSTTPAAPQIPPEERFRAQLQQLNEMGFYDTPKNIRALQVCQGDVNLAIERLLDPSFN